MIYLIGYVEERQQALVESLLAPEFQTVWNSLAHPARAKRLLKEARAALLLTGEMHPQDAMALAYADSLGVPVVGAADRERDLPLWSAFFTTRVLPLPSAVQHLKETFLLPSEEVEKDPEPVEGILPIRRDDLSHIRFDGKTVMGYRRA